ncbi:beta-1,3-galactosyltransferase 5-like [Agrilus planipennis]|uniref:Hexosyltransferase n=1 Tax=Agrilus planipennis TaxID=224129 RepID=A0A1W4X2W7_AGRPL|nr:beta-1,3-galactosyltransferase 5-like [Agrilus planipennis]
MQLRMLHKVLRNGPVQVVLFILIVIFVILYYHKQYSFTSTSDNNGYINMNDTNLLEDTLKDKSAVTTSTIAPTVTEPEILDPVRMIYEEGHVDVDPFICENPYGNITLTIMVTSAVQNLRARMDVRLTWGHWSIRNDVKIIFMVGQTSDEKVQSEVRNEQNLYHDVVQGHFMDTYNNLTLKTVFMLEWLSINCPNTAFVLKTDEDMFINVPKLLDYLSTKDPKERTFHGRLFGNWKPDRNPKSKYYVSLNAYKDSEFPPMFSGTAYVFPGFLAHELFQASLNHTFLKLEDVFLTGLVAKELGIGHTHWLQFYNLGYAKLTPCNIRRVVAIHNVRKERQFEAWLKVNDMRLKC